jgi:glyoxylase-like metal-dependent hydrolase (beta-lactamase superfamily II)
VIVVNAEQPNLWTLEQAHYLLAQMHRRNLDLKAKSLDDLDPNEIAGLRFDVMHTPGHTPGSVCFRAEEFVLSGDLVFAGSVGRHDLANSSPADMRESLRRFLTLPDPLSVHPGHGPSTSVGTERSSNPFLVELR